MGFIIMVSMLTFRLAIYTYLRFNSYDALFQWNPIPTGIFYCTFLSEFVISIFVLYKNLSNNNEKTKDIDLGLEFSNPDLRNDTDDKSSQDGDALYHHQ